MKFESIKSDKFQAFEQSQIKQLNAITGGEEAPIIVTGDVTGTTFSDCGGGDSDNDADYTDYTCDGSMVPNDGYK